MIHRNVPIHRNIPMNNYVLSSVKHGVLYVEARVIILRGI